MRFDPAASELLQQHRQAKHDERDADRRLREFLRDNPQAADDDRFKALLEECIAAGKRAKDIWKQLEAFRIED